MKQLNNSNAQEAYRAYRIYILYSKSQISYGNPKSPIQASLACASVSVSDDVGLHVCVIFQCMTFIVIQLIYIYA